MTNPIYLVEPTIRWRELIELKIPNENLKKRIETFLNVLERSVFRYEGSNASTGQSEDRYFSGQDFLKRVSNVKENIGTWLEENKGSKVADYFATTSVCKNGKFMISQHSRSFNGNPTNGTQTLFLGNQTIGAYPIGFEIGTDYLKGTKYLGVDQKLHPVSVDAAVVHELAHIAYNTSDEDVPIMIEGIVTSALGAVKRADDHGIIYKKDTNGGFWLLSHKVQNNGALKEEFADKVNSDFNTTSHSDRCDHTNAMASVELVPLLK